MKSRSLSLFVSLVSLVMLAPLAPGCDGETAPTPTDKKPEQLQKEQQDIMRKEYGPGVDKARKR